MRFEPTAIAGLWAVRLHRSEDERGSFARLFAAAEFVAHGLPDRFVQCSLSMTHCTGTLRGLHLQRPPHAEHKLVHCVRGAIHDVVVDLRPGSPTCRRWQAFTLADDGDLALCIPPGCAHGFQTLRDDCEVLYHMDAAYSPEHADGVRFDDPALAIDWPLPVTTVSARDRAWPLLRPFLAA
jgi:dTDP-4-dehydrorhamnose 3,5-epimerase